VIRLLRVDSLHAIQTDALNNLFQPDITPLTNTARRTSDTTLRGFARVDNVFMICNGSYMITCTFTICLYITERERSRVLRNAALDHISKARGLRRRFAQDIP